MNWFRFNQSGPLLLAVAAGLFLVWGYATIFGH